MDILDQEERLKRLKMARSIVKAVIRRNGQKISSFTAKEINAMAKVALEIAEQPKQRIKE